MKKCKLCNNLKGETLTTDKQEICFKCYSKVFNELFKGQFTIKEALNTLEFIKHYQLKVLDICLLIKKSAQSSKIDAIGLMYSITAQENMIALDMFNKERQCLKRDEHLIVIELLLKANTLKVFDNFKFSNRYEADKQLQLDYLKGCEYLKWVI